MRFARGFKWLVISVGINVIRAECFPASPAQNASKLILRRGLDLRSSMIAVLIIEALLRQAKRNPQVASQSQLVPWQSWCSGNTSL